MEYLIPPRCLRWFLRDHASNIPLILNLTSSKISPLFHVVFDDWFATVAAPVNALPDSAWDDLFCGSRIQFVFNDDDPSHFRLIGPTLQRNFMQFAKIRLMKLLPMTPLLRLITHHRRQGGMYHSLLRVHLSFTRLLPSTNHLIRISPPLPVVLRLHLHSIHHALPPHRLSKQHPAIYLTLPPSGINFSRQFHPRICSLRRSFGCRYLRPNLNLYLGDPTVSTLLHLRLHLAAPHVAPNHGTSCILLLSVLLWLTPSPLKSPPTCHSSIPSRDYRITSMPPSRQHLDIHKARFWTPLVFSPKPNPYPSPIPILFGITKQCRPQIAPASKQQ